MNKNTTEQLSPEKFAAIAGAFSRLQQLGEKQIATGPGDNSLEEREKLIEYLATEMLCHIAEFLAAWQLCNLEYLPALRGLQAIARRCGYAPTPALNFPKEVQNAE